MQSNEYITISGIASETKDGYYIDGYVLEYNEIQKYDADDVLSQYHNKNIEVVGKGKEVNSDCEPYTQCRQGPYKAMYDVKSIKVIP